MKSGGKLRGPQTGGFWAKNAYIGIAILQFLYKGNARTISLLETSLVTGQGMALSRNCNARNLSLLEKLFMTGKAWRYRAIAMPEISHFSKSYL